MITKRQTSTTSLHRIIPNKITEPKRDRSYELYRNRRTTSQANNFISNVYNDMSISGSNIFQIKISDCKEEELDIRVNRVNTKIFESKIATPYRIINFSTMNNYRESSNIDLRDSQFKKNCSGLTILKKQVDLCNILVSTQIVAVFRAKLINWMIEVIKNYPEKCTDYTLYRAIIILDLYLKRNKEKSVDKQSIHLIGITCMYIATKYEDIYPIRLHDFVHIIGYSKYTKDQILQTEYSILRTLSFLISFPAYGEFVDFFTGNVISKFFNRMTLDKINYLCHYVVLLNLHKSNYGDYKIDNFVVSCVIFVLRFVELSVNVNSWNHVKHDEIANVNGAINELLTVVPVAKTEIDRLLIFIRSNIDFFDKECSGLGNLKKYFDRYPLKLINKVFN